MNQSQPENQGPAADFSVSSAPVVAQNGGPDHNPGKSNEEVVRLAKDVAKLAHDASQPLTYLLTVLELAADSTGADAEECHDMLRAALQVRDLIQELRDLVRKARTV